MHAHRPSPDFDPAHLCMLGISHHTVALQKRELFSLDKEAKSMIYHYLKNVNAQFCLILSTCNRTEIYIDRSLLNEAQKVWSVVRGLTSQDQRNIQTVSGYDAVSHLFSVASGIDSQIPGDLQIVQQVKDAFTEAKAHGLGSGLLEKLINQAVHCSKRVKTETELSTGISSVASAVTMLVRKHFKSHHRIVILGTGKIGKISGRNLVKTIPGASITLVNRTDAKAADLAKAIGVNMVSYDDRDQALREADIVVVATASPKPVITRDQIKRDTLILDLTVPSALDPEIAGVPGVRITNLDALSQLVSEHLGKRSHEIEHAVAIVEQELKECRAWWHRRAQYIRNTPEILPKVRRRYA